jgi:outer membrane protein assembly factor BamB
MITIFGIVISLLLFSCNKGEDDLIPTPNPCDTCQVSNSKLQMVWQEPLWIDTGHYNSSDPIYWNDNVLFSAKIDGGEILRMRNANTGKLIWEWNEHLSPNNRFSHSKFVHKGNLIYCTSNEVYSINLENGQTIWAYKNPTGNGLPFISVFGDYVFHTHVSGKFPNLTSYLVRANINEGVWDTIYTIKMKDGYTPFVSPPGIWINPHGDTILISQNRSYNYPASDGQIDLIAYNMNKDSILYEIIDLDPQGDSNVRPPLVWEDKVYFIGVRTVYCIDAPTGEIIWKKYFSEVGEHLWTCNILIAEDKLIVNPDNQNLYALDPHTGEEIWKETNSGSTCWNDMVFYEGVVYFGSWGEGRLYAVDAQTGEHIWAEQSPNKAKDSRANINTGVAINPDLGYIYTADGFFAMCFKLPER